MKRDLICLLNKDCEIIQIEAFNCIKDDKIKERILAASTEDELKKIFLDINKKYTFKKIELMSEKLDEIKLPIISIETSRFPERNIFLINRFDKIVNFSLEGKSLSKTETPGFIFEDSDIGSSLQICVRNDSAKHFNLQVSHGSNLEYVFVDERKVA